MKVKIGDLVLPFCATIRELEAGSRNPAIFADGKDEAAGNG